MATSNPTQLPADPIIDLTDDTMFPSHGHRLAELVQALTGCSVERAELALGDPIAGPATGDSAIDSVARALVRLRSRQPA